MTPNQELINRISKESKDELLKVIDDTSIVNIIYYLKERSIISLAGRAATEARVNKEALKVAIAYLQDYLDILSNDI